MLLGTAALGALFLRAPLLPAEAREVVVGKFLPPVPSSPGFVFFKASTKDTPALRAGDDSIPSCIALLASALIPDLISRPSCFGEDSPDLVLGH